MPTQPPVPPQPSSPPSWFSLVARCHTYQDPKACDLTLRQLSDHASRFPELDPIRTRISPLGSVAYLVIHPGELAMIGGVAPVNLDFDTPSYSEDAAENLSQLMESVEADVEMLQVVLHSHSFTPEHRGWLEQCYKQAGLEPLAELVQLAADVPASLERELEEAETSELAFVLWEPRWNDPLCEIVDRTYQATLDVPELNGVRSTKNTLVGYSNMHRSNNRPWWLLRHRGVWSGCLLACQHGEDVVEMVYVGVVPEKRGEGLGTQAVDFLFAWARREGVKQILLAVDRRNEPAIAIYGRRGFYLLGSAVAWFRQGKRNGTAL